MEEGENQVANRILESLRLQSMEEEEDRISALPDCLLVEILSRLSYTKGAIRTGALSKRWKHVWTLVPSLCFYEYKHTGTLSDFVSSVDGTLTQRPQYKLEMFDVDTSYDFQFDSRFKNWIRYAITCNVEALYFTLKKPCSKAAELSLDESFFTNSCFTDLALEGCMFKPVGAIRWKNMMSLYIAYVNLDEDLIENILSGTPQLETLALYDCYGYRRLNITSKSIKKLLFYGYKDPNDKSVSNIIEINAPNILSLTIGNPLMLRKLLLLNVSSLLEAHLDYTSSESIPKEAEEDMLKGFILNLSPVKDLHIWVSCSKVLSRLGAKGFIFPSNMKFHDVTHVIR